MQHPLEAINPVLEPLGFDWKMGLSLVAGLAAKEVVISTLGTVYAVGGDDKNPAPLTDYLQNDPNFSPLIALTMMLFVLIYPPCLATLAVIKRVKQALGNGLHSCSSMKIHLHGLHVSSSISIGRALGF